MGLGKCWAFNVYIQVQVRFQAWVLSYLEARLQLNVVHAPTIKCHLLQRESVHTISFMHFLCPYWKSCCRTAAWCQLFYICIIAVSNWWFESFFTTSLRQLKNNILFCWNCLKLVVKNNLKRATQNYLNGATYIVNVPAELGHRSSLGRTWISCDTKWMWCRIMHCSFSCK